MTGSRVGRVGQGWTGWTSNPPPSVIAPSRVTRSDCSLPLPLNTREGSVTDSHQGSLFAPVPVQPVQPVQPPHQDRRRAPAETYRPDVCPACRATVLIGITDGLTLRLDPARLDLPTEIAALADGRLTYDLHPDRHAVWRSARRIRDWPDHHPVHATHACHRPLLDTGPVHAPTPVQVPASDAPPF